MSTTKREAVKQTIRIKHKAYDYRVFDRSAKRIIDTAERTGEIIAGQIQLPTERSMVTINKSSFKHKDAREQFEVRIHKRIIDVLDPNPKTLDSLMNLDLPAGVDIEIKT